MRNRTGHRLSLYLNPEGDNKEAGMKPDLTRITMGLFLLATLLGAIPTARAHSCSTQKAAGDYGFTLTGVILTSTGGIPAAAVGRATWDRQIPGLLRGARGGPCGLRRDVGRRAALGF